MTWREGLGAEVVFAAYDLQLWRAAGRLQFATFPDDFLQLSPTRGERLRRGRRRRDGARGAADGGVQDRSLTGFLPLGSAELAGMVFAPRK